MKTKQSLRIFAILLVIVLMATTVSASSPYSIPSGPEFLASIYGGAGGATGKEKTCLSATTKEDAESHDFCWWRDTTNQNAIADYSADEFTGTVSTAFSGYGGLTVLVYNSADGPNVTAIIESAYGGDLWIVGPGGGRAEANNAKIAFQNYYTDFTGKTLRGIIYTDATPEGSWGSTYWWSIFRSTPLAPIYASAEFDHARADRDAVGNELLVREIMAYGRALTGTGTTGDWGPDAFLGVGTMKEYNPNLPSFLPPGPNDILISEPTFVSVSGLLGFYLAPANDRYGTLKVYLVDRHIGGYHNNPSHAGFDLNNGYDAFSVKAVISGDVGAKFLSGAGSIAQPFISIEDEIANLDQTRSMVNNEFTTDTTGTFLIPSHGPWANCQPGTCNFLADKREALQYIRDQTVKYINYHYPLDDIVTKVNLPPNLANSPYTRQFAATTPMLVHSVYHEYLGWFTEDPFELTPMNTMEQAQRLVDMAGGVDTALVIARKAATGHSLSGANWAFYLTRAIRMTNPSAQADGIYIAALQQLAWSAQSAQVRNYYLSLIQEAQMNPAP
jgi:hypothetical protein